MQGDRKAKDRMKDRIEKIEKVDPIGIEPTTS